jgi:hypothetical protein
MNDQNSLSVLKENQQTLQAITLFNYGADKDVSSIVLNEISFLEGMAVTKPEILACENTSIVMATKYVLKNNLSFDPNAGLVYVKTRSVALQKDSSGNVSKWGKVLEVQATCEGLLSIAYQCGKIIDHERPSVKKNDAGKVIEVTFKYMKPSPIGPRWVEVTFDESDFKRWQIKSHQENSRSKNDAGTKDYSNPNYRNFNTGIDPEFARAKAIRHAMKKMGTNPNERLSVFVKPAIQNTIDKSVDMNATNEDIPAGENTDNGYVAYEETQNESGSTAKVHVTTHEEIEIPSSL